MKVKSFFKNLKNNKVASKLNKLFYSPLFPIIIAVFTLASNLFSLELLAYSVFAVFFCLIMLFSKNLLPIIPFVLGAYFSPSNNNNPAKNSNSIFYTHLWFIITLCLVMFICFLIRLIFDDEFGFKSIFKTRKKLLFGLAVLCASFFISGIFSQNYLQYALKNLLYSLVLSICFTVLYVVLTSCVKWDNEAIDFVLYTCLIFGLALVVEVVYIYFNGNVIVDGSIIRENIVTGWGIGNNIGALLCMFMPCAFGLAILKNRGYIYNVLGNVLLVGVLFTQSRGAMLTAFILYATLAILVLLKSKERFFNGLVYAVVLLLFLIFLIVFFNKIVTLMSDIINRGFTNTSNRNNIYALGISEFLKAPIFGSTFYNMPIKHNWIDGALISFLPTGWHNTVLQFLVSGGVVGLTAYLYHRTQTVIMVFKNKGVVTYLVGLSILGLLITSLFDCHLFSFGPTLIYSIFLAVLEKCQKQD